MIKPLDVVVPKEVDKEGITESTKPELLLLRTCESTAIKKKKKLC